MSTSLRSNLQRGDEISRRSFAAKTASTLLGVGLLPDIFASKAHAAFENSSMLKQVATAKNVIYLYMGGGQSHLDTWDPKEGVADRRPDKADQDQRRRRAHLRVSAARRAKQMHHACVVNSLTSTQGAHEQGNYMMHTSYELRGTIRHPSMGAWLNVFQGGGNSTLPNFVFIGNDSRHPGAGFFPAQYSPLLRQQS